MIQRFKEWWRNFKTGTITQVDKSFNKNQIEDEKIPENLDHQRQMAQGRLKDVETEKEALEQSIKGDRDVKPGQYLQDRQETLSKQNLENHVSLRQWFREVENGNLEIGLTNQDRTRTFGQFQDIVIDDRGMMFIVNEEGDLVMGGANWGDLVQSPAGMITDMTAGYLPLNLDDDGRHLPSEATVEVPQIVYTEGEGIVFTEQHTEKYKKQLSTYQQRVQTLSKQNRMKEAAMVGMSQQIKKLKREKDTLQVIAESEQEGRETIEEMAHNAIGQYRQQEIEINKTDSVREFWEEIGKASLNAQSEAVDDMIEEINMDEFETAEETFRRAIKMFTEEMPKMTQGGGQTPTPTQGGGGSGGSQADEWE